MNDLEIELPPKLIPLFAPARGSLRFRAAHGGRGSGKSFNFAKMAAIWGAIEPMRILCVRELQNSIKESFHAELKNAISSCPWLSTQYNVGIDYLRHNWNGTEFIFRGLRHNMASVKSMAQIDLCIAEEAETIPDESWQDLLPTIRAKGSEIWVIYNPKSPKSWVYQTFQTGKVPPRTNVVEMNYMDNPWFGEELEEQRLDAYSRMPRELYDHIWLGKTLAPSSDNAVIKRAWLIAAIDAHVALDIEPTGTWRIGYDIADDGDDCNATVTTHGVVALHCEEWDGESNGLLKSASRVHAMSRMNNKAEITYDSIGVGASAGAKFNELNEKLPAPDQVVHTPFNAGAGVYRPNREYMPGIKNKDFFANLKAQSWWMVADRLRKTYEWVVDGVPCDPDEIISLSGSMKNLNALIDQLAIPERDFDGAGKVKVESKKDLRKRGVDSPNSADAFIMAYAPTNLRKRGGIAQ